MFSLPYDKKIKEENVEARSAWLTQNENLLNMQGKMLFNMFENLLSEHCVKANQAKVPDLGLAETWFCF